MATRKLTGEALAVELKSVTGHLFRDHARLRRALTHASARGSTGSDYERLEFLGDRVLGLVIADLLFNAYPDAAEGELSLRLNALVNAETLAEIAEEIGLPNLIHAGGEIRSMEGRKRVNLRADALESLIAALYLEGGIEAAQNFILRYWEPRSKALREARRDAKTALQEWGHQAAAATPIYAMESREGPDHDPVFTISVTIGEFEPGRGVGRSKREAEQAAATALLLREGVWEKKDVQ
ncbi:ribonuclease III [Mesorhizobium sp. NBSH29]|uniref:ribonuclease III n=1 Tax=Mesorhizobium sp. NBSH29 TaxID=2654249 RepID=UPI00189652FA|nr:ribonuclease III [Mesorhizobium sp. NBSH29]QPC87273.1 ribonuclease III [Mesorhizobium sp. NBSH29]